MRGAKFLCSRARITQVRPFLAGTPVAESPGMTLLMVTIALAMVLLAIAIARPAMLVHGGGKAFGFVGILALPLLCLGMGGNQHIETSKTTAFCTSCHVMERYGKSLMIDDPRHL